MTLLDSTSGGAVDPPEGEGTRLRHRDQQSLVEQHQQERESFQTATGPTIEPCSTGNAAIAAATSNGSSTTQSAAARQSTRRRKKQYVLFLRNYILYQKCCW